MNLHFKNILLLISAAASLAGCVDENYQESVAGRTDSQLLSNVIAAQSELSVFNELLESEGLLPLLVSRQTQDQRAVFAPTNAAIEDFMSANGFESAEDIAGLDRVLAYHIADPNIRQADLSQTNFNFIQTNADQDIFVNRSGGQVRFNNQTVNILRSETGNGTVHLIDEVLLPRSNTMAAYLNSNPELSIFSEVVALLGLESELSADFRTLFVPDNQAFLDLLDAMGAGSLGELVDMLGEPALRDIVRYHIVNGLVYSANVSNNQALTPQFQGEIRPRVSTDGDNVMLTYAENNAASTMVTVNDEIFQTGFVHVIDKVMVPVLGDE
ncbi:Uncaracterized surface protein containing fasciclin (FAS1) repeats [Cyclobacterium lianum]|uniref:Uncaracterized surface protein containing fasciclin (FAS1) repeats n=1 Tax=Cyclobacterium lianum TaxID=388280 RepID=A0A1M7IGG4_9BACT|nr:fasciclin domain-containing protein [Cyclobacterium lianum]SHM39688.1 Uncaracterized surface protein containing fasciclin (FAS1) repeats [Cyclobacterium lianum]